MVRTFFIGAVCSIMWVPTVANAIVPLEQDRTPIVRKPYERNEIFSRAETKRLRSILTTASTEENEDITVKIEPIACGKLHQVRVIFKGQPDRLFQLIPAWEGKHVFAVSHAVKEWVRSELMKIPNSTLKTTALTGMYGIAGFHVIQN